MAKKPGNKSSKTKKPKSKKEQIMEAKIDKMIDVKLNKEIESKHAYTQLVYTKFNSGITAVGDIIPCLPNIARGTGDNERIGDQLKGQSLKITGYMRLDNNFVTNSSKLSNVMARLLIVSLKTEPNISGVQASSTPLTSLLKKGGTTSAFNGTLSDLWAPVNTDLWTVHHDKHFYLSQDLINAAGSPTTYVAPLATKDTIRFFSLSVPCKKTMKYDANVSSNLLPTNFGPVALLGYAYLDNSSADVVDTKLGMAFDVSFTYQDA